MLLSVAPDIDRALVFPSVVGSRRYFTRIAMRTLSHQRIFKSRNLTLYCTYRPEEVRKLVEYTSTIAFDTLSDTM